MLCSYFTISHHNSCAFTALQRIHTFYRHIQFYELAPAQHNFICIRIPHAKIASHTLARTPTQSCNANSHRQCARKSRAIVPPAAGCTRNRVNWFRKIRLHAQRRRRRVGAKCALVCASDIGCIRHENMPARRRVSAACRMARQHSAYIQDRSHSCAVSGDVLA